MKKNITIAVFILSLLTGVSVMGADVENVSFSYEPGFTIAKIDVKGTIRFTHQTVIAKDGKPFRVILDILSAEHKLGAKNFNSFPSCAVSQIRSSQYSVKPEKIVRLVFDMKSEIMYQIMAEKNKIIIKFPDKKSAKFVSWSSKAFLDAQNNKKSAKAVASKPAAKKSPAKTTKTTSVANSSGSSKTVASLNKAIESDRQGSLQSKSSSTAATKTVASTKTKKSGTSTTASKTIASTRTKKSGKTTTASKTVASVDTKKSGKTTTASKTVASVDTKKSGKATASKALASSTVKKSSKVATDSKTIASTKTKKSGKVTTTSKTVASSSVEKSGKATTTSKTVASTKTKKSGKSTASKTVASTKSKKSSKATASKTVASTKSKKSSKATASKTVASTKSKKSSKAATTSKTLASSTVKKSSKAATSRFRRRSSRSNKIKGTMVAEFPKRLVIKYKARASRDPFETLVNEAKVTNTIVNKTRPNVEGLTLVGIIESEDGKNQALFEDKSGFGYILKAGDKVQKGYVLKVKNDRVYFQIFEYGWSRTMALNLDVE